MCFFHFVYPIFIEYLSLLNRLFILFTVIYSSFYFPCIRYFFQNLFLLMHLFKHIFIIYSLFMLVICYLGPGGMGMGSLEGSTMRNFIVCTVHLL
jgi:hypothetical protein